MIILPPRGKKWELLIDPQQPEIPANQDAHKDRLRTAGTTGDEGRFQWTPGETGQFLGWGKIPRIFKFFLAEKMRLNI